MRCTCGKEDVVYLANPVEMPNALVAYMSSIGRNIFRETRALSIHRPSLSLANTEQPIVIVFVPNASGDTETNEVNAI